MKKNSLGFTFPPSTKKKSVLVGLSSGLVLLLVTDVMGDDAIEKLAARLKENREQIQTIDCQFSVSGSDPKGADCISVHWIESGNVARWRVSKPGGVTTEFLWKDGVQKQVAKAPLGTEIYVSGTVNAQSRSSFDFHSEGPWTHIHYQSHFSPHRPVYEYILQPEVQAVVEQVPGKPTQLLVRCSTKGVATCDLYFDTEKNYMPVQVAYYVTPDKSYRLERNVEEDYEIKPGIFLPKKIEQRVYKKGQLDRTAQTVFTDVRINEPIDPSVLELRFPSGLVVLDQIRGQTYTVGENEIPQPGTERAVAVSKDEQDRQEALRPWYKRWMIWLNMALVLILAIFGFRFYRRRISLSSA